MACEEGWLRWHPRPWASLTPVYLQQYEDDEMSREMLALATPQPAGACSSETG